MNKRNIVLALVILVVLLFAFQPNLLGSGSGTPLQVIGQDSNTMEIQTDVSCSTQADCIDYVLSQDPEAIDIVAQCDGTCTFIVDKTPLEVQQ